MPEIPEMVPTGFHFNATNGIYEMYSVHALRIYSKIMLLQHNTEHSQH